MDQSKAGYKKLDTKRLQFPPLLKRKLKIKFIFSG